MRRTASPDNSHRAVMFSAAAFILSAMVFLAVLFDRGPLLEQKFESLRFRILALIPPPAHTEFVPTPLPTPTGVAELLNTPTPESTDTPTLTPTFAAPSTSSTATPTTDPSALPTETLTATPAVAVRPVQPAVHLTGWIHDYQGWNNCGPTTLEMALSFFGYRHTQAEIARVLKPDPDDKNVRPDEMAAYVQQDGHLDGLVRVNGTIDRIKLLVSNNLPVIVETGFDPPQAHEGWMGHYRLVTGYNNTSSITQDSYDGPNVMVDFNTLDSDWRAFNRTYIVVYAPGQAPLVRAILGDDMNDQKMYNTAVAVAQSEEAANPKDPFASFNLGSSLVGLEQYPEAAAAFDHARLLNLPWRMLWYQFGPYEAYYHTGRYDELISLANATLKVVDDLEESHYYKGLALEATGHTDLARVEFNTALRYNKNYLAAQRELAQASQP